MLRCSWLYVVLFAFLPSSLPAAESGGYWPQWRGPNRDNVSTDTGLLQSWPEGGPPLRWSVEGIGNGTAAVAVAAGRVYAPPDLPFNWGPRPPSVNRLPGLIWLAYVARGRPFDNEFHEDVSRFLTAFYHVTPTAAQLDRLLGN